MSLYTQSNHYITCNVTSNIIYKIQHNQLSHTQIERLSFEIPLTIYEIILA